MTLVTISPKYQVVIPQAVRKTMSIRPGQQVDVMVWDGVITLVPIVPIAEARGMLRGIPNDFEREKDREF